MLRFGFVLGEIDDAPGAKEFFCPLALARSEEGWPEASAAFERGLRNTSANKQI